MAKKLLIYFGLSLLFVAIITFAKYDVVLGLLLWGLRTIGYTNKNFFFSLAFFIGSVKPLIADYIFTHILHYRFQYFFFFYIFIILTSSRKYFYSSKNEGVSKFSEDI